MHNKYSSLTPDDYATVAADELTFLISDMLPGSCSPDTSAPFLFACEQIAREFYAQFQRAPDMLLVKERDLLSKKADLSRVRDSIEVIEAALVNFSGAKLNEAYRSLFSLVEKRTELENEVWELDRALFMLKNQSFA